MKRKHVFTLPALVLVAGMVAWAADDGAALFKTKCSGCHGQNGEGKTSKKAPDLRGTKLEADQVASLLMKGDANHRAPHKKHIAGLTETQGKAIAEHVKTLK